MSSKYSPPYLKIFKIVAYMKDDWNVCALFEMNRGAGDDIIILICFNLYLKGALTVERFLVQSVSYQCKIRLDCTDKVKGQLIING